MKSFIKNSAFELSVIAGVMLVCFICFKFGRSDYKQKYELEHYKFEQAQKALDSLQIQKTELLRSAALHVNSADSAWAMMTAKGQEKLKIIQKKKKIKNTIDNWTFSQLDSAFAVN